MGAAAAAGGAAVGGGGGGDGGPRVATTYEYDPARGMFDEVRCGFGGCGGWLGWLVGACMHGWMDVRVYGGGKGWFGLSRRPCLTISTTNGTQWETLGEDPDAGWSVVTSKRKAKQPPQGQGAQEEGEAGAEAAGAGEEEGSP